VLTSDNDICGISVSLRKSGDNVITLWNSNAKGFHVSKFVERAQQLVSLEVHNPVYRVHREQLEPSS